MKKNIILTTVLLVGFLIYTATGNTKPIIKKLPSIAPSNNYTSFVLWPGAKSDVVSGEAAGVAINSNGMVFYLHRGESSYGDNSLIQEYPLLKIDPSTGDVLGKYCKNILKSPHGLAVDSKDNIWITDTSLNKVLVFDSEGKLLKTYGDDYKFYQETLYRIKNILPQFPLFASNMTFARPTDIFPNEDGSFILTDGYRNKRLLKISEDGKIMWEINKFGNNNGELNLPHGVAVDSEGNIYVADRSNARVQVFTSDGIWKSTWDSQEIGRPFGLEVGPDNMLYVADGGDQLYGAEDSLTSGIVIMDLDGNIIERISRFGTNIGDVNIPHDIAVGKDGNIYVAELKNRRLQVFIKNKDN